MELGSQPCCARKPDRHYVRARLSREGSIQDDCAIGDSKATREGITTPVRQSYRDRFETIRRRLWPDRSKKAFEPFENNGRRRGNELDDWLRTEAELSRRVRWGTSSQTATALCVRECLASVKGSLKSKGEPGDGVSREGLEVRGISGYASRVLTYPRRSFR
jgi:hypothetical protein